MATLEEQVAQTTPGEIVCMLYDRAVQDLAGASELFALEDDPRSKADAIHLVVHAQQIVAELNHCLNVDTGGELAKNLARLYEYVQYRLTEAVSKYDRNALTEARGLLVELSEAWHTMENRKEASNG